MPTREQSRWPRTQLALGILALTAGCGGGGDTTAPNSEVGVIQVSTVTTGVSLDADGYTATLDGTSSSIAVPVNGSASFNGVAAGSHTVLLTGVAANCQVAGGNPLAVTVTGGATAPVAFAVSCAEPPPQVGVLRITTTTSGTDPDADGYRFTVDGARSDPIGVNATTDLANTAAGAHTVVLSDVAANCSVDAVSKSATVASGAAATVAFTITCAALPPTTGSIRVTTSTTGPDPDNSYRFVIDAGSSDPIAGNTSATIGNIAAGPHTVRLSSIAGNCSVAGGATKNVSVTAGATSEVAFSVTCTSLTPSASRSSMAATPRTMFTGESSAITVTVRNVNGGAVPNTTVTLSATGSGNSITPASATTNASGVATFTFSSTVEGSKTISATAGGVTLTDTETIFVQRRPTTTVIFEDQPDPSPVGTPIQVRFRVTAEDGVTPTTGTVAVSSDQEADVGCEAVSLDAQGEGFCDFALSIPGTHTIRAAYSGNTQFEESDDPDGEAHLVTP